MPNYHFLQNNVVVATAVFPEGAVISVDGTQVTWAGGVFTAPAGETFMNQVGAGVGWVLSGDVLLPPSSIPPTVPQLRASANTTAQTLLGTARTYVLTGGLSVLCDASTATGVDLQSLTVWGSANPSATTNWVDDNGGVVTLTGAQCVALAQAALAYAQSVYVMLATAMNGIANLTITTTAQIAALSWPT